jgi:hypothetical protein
MLDVLYVRLRLRDTTAPWIANFLLSHPRYFLRDHQKIAQDCTGFRFVFKARHGAHSSVMYLLPQRPEDKQDGMMISYRGPNLCHKKTGTAVQAVPEKTATETRFSATVAPFRPDDD